PRQLLGFRPRPRWRLLRRRALPAFLLLVPGYPFSSAPGTPGSFGWWSRLGGIGVRGGCGRFPAAPKLRGAIRALPLVPPWRDPPVRVPHLRHASPRWTRRRWRQRRQPRRGRVPGGATRWARRPARRGCARRLVSCCLRRFRRDRSRRSRHRWRWARRESVRTSGRVFSQSSFCAAEWPQTWDQNGKLARRGAGGVVESWQCHQRGTGEVGRNGGREVRRYGGREAGRTRRDERGTEKLCGARAIRLLLKTRIAPFLC